MVGVGIGGRGMCESSILNLFYMNWGKITPSKSVNFLLIV